MLNKASLITIELQNCYEKLKHKNCGNGFGMFTTLQHIIVCQKQV